MKEYKQQLEVLGKEIYRLEGIKELTEHRGFSELLDRLETERAKSFIDLLDDKSGDVQKGYAQCMNVLVNIMRSLMSGLELKNRIQEHELLKEQLMRLELDSEYRQQNISTGGEL